MALLTWLILAVVIALVLMSSSKGRKAKDGEKLPPMVGGWIPFFGCIHLFATDPMGVVLDHVKKLGEVFTLRILGYNMTFMVGPEAHAAFFKAGDDEVSPKEAYRFVVPVFGRGVVYDSPTHIMYEQLKFVRSGLNIAALKRSVTMINSQAVQFLEPWGKTVSAVELLDQMNQLTIMTASRCLLGKEINESPKVSATFAKLFHDLEGGLNPLAFFYPYLPIPAHRVRDKARLEISDLFKDVLAKRRAGEPQEDMMQALIDAKYKNGETLDDDKICGLLVGLLFAGQHTSGITTTWTLLNLANNSEWRDNVLREQQELISKFDGEITFESLKESVVLEQCVRETLRLFPPLIHLMRMVKKPVSYKGITIPVGDLICISPGAAMRHIYENGDKWDPSRMTAEKLQKDVLDYKFIAFGGGRHGCPGEAFGITQVKTLLTTVLRKYEIGLMAPLPTPDYRNLVVGPLQPYNVKVALRTVPIEKLTL